MSAGNTCIPHTQEVGLLDKTHEQMEDIWMNVYLEGFCFDVDSVC